MTGSRPRCDGAQQRMQSDRAEPTTRPTAWQSPAHQAEPEGDAFRGALALLLIAALLIGWPWLSGRVTIPWDAKAHFQPQIQFLAHSLADGQWPFWTPYVFAGHPQIADPQSMIFPPPFLALALIDGSPSLRASVTTLLARRGLSGAARIVWHRDQRWRSA